MERTKLIALGQGIARSGAGNVGVSIMGVEPSVEALTSPLTRNIVRGEYLADGDKSLVVVGHELAARLNLEVGKKLVVTTNDIHGDLVEQLCRVKGVFKTGSEEIDALLFCRPPWVLPARCFRCPRTGPPGSAWSCKSLITRSGF